MSVAADPILADQAERLRQLVAFYAAGADRRDTHLFLRAFSAEAVLVVHRWGSVQSRFAGTDQLATIVPRLERYQRTHHQLGQSRIWKTGHEMRAETYCTARHLSVRDADEVQLVMYIRYEDTFGSDADGQWGIVLRDVHIDWSEERSSVGAAGGPA